MKNEQVSLESFLSPENCLYHRYSQIIDEIEPMFIPYRVNLIYKKMVMLLHLRPVLVMTYKSCNSSQRTAKFLEPDRTEGGNDQQYHIRQVGAYQKTKLHFLQYLDFSETIR